MTESPLSPIRPPTKEPGRLQAGITSLLTVRATDVLWYRVADEVSGALILAMIVFSPWAFGTTQPWSIWTMTIAGYLLGILLFVKLFIRQAKGYPAPRWGNYSSRSGTLSRRYHPALRQLLRVLVFLTAAVLTECLVSIWNAAADYDPATGLFHYHRHLAWLPASLDGRRTCFYFWMYLGLAGSFWSVWDWLGGMTSREERTVLGGGKNLSAKAAPSVPARLRLLLWVLCVNGALLGLEAIVQRASGSNKLLFLVVPHVHIDGESQFGPYAYRSNAAQYFNLLWPVCLGFWLALQRAHRGKKLSHHWLLPCAAIMAACPIISTSRAGALVAGGMLLLAFVYLGVSGLSATARPESQPPPSLAMRRKRQPFPSPSLSPLAPTPVAPATVAGESPPIPRQHHVQQARTLSRPGASGWLLMIFLMVTLGLAWLFGWSNLSPRMAQIGSGYDYREEMYAAARPMARDYPLFGTGPGTFGTVFQLYRYSAEVYWPEQLHNDWLETRITFGWLGFALLMAALLAVALRAALPGGLRASRQLVGLAWLSLGGCLVFAEFDYPFQVHSTLLLFLLICALLLNVGRSEGTTRE